MEHYWWSLILIVILGGLLRLQFIIIDTYSTRNFIEGKKYKEQSKRYKRISLGLMYTSIINLLSLGYVIIYGFIGMGFGTLPDVQLFINIEGRAPYYNSRFVVDEENEYINEACLKYYGKTSDELYSATYSTGEGYFDYIIIDDNINSISFNEYLKALIHFNHEPLSTKTITMNKQTANLSLTGELKKIIKDRTITYQIGDYTLSGKVYGELDGYFGKYVKLDIVYKSATTENLKHISEYVVISAEEVAEGGM